ncbi:MAG: CPBP family intramembrane glutamic endopeptidase [Fimbriimonas sp.]
MQEVPRRKALWLELGALTAWILFPILVGPFIRQHSSGAYDALSPWFNVESGLAYLGQALLLLFVLWVSGDRWKRFGLRRLRWTDALVAAFLTACVLCVQVLPSRMAIQDLDEYRRLFPPPHGFAIGASIVFAVGTGVFFEELFFRGYLIHRLEELTGNVWIGVVASAFFFGFYHLYQGPFSAFLALGIGLTYGIAFVGCRSLWPIVASHAIWNLSVTYL